MILSDGQLFIWGENSSGQLGLGRIKCRSPQPVMSLFGIPLDQISAGGDHSFALSVTGVVFGWGKNHAGQLGLGHTESTFIVRIAINLKNCLLNNVNVKQI